MRTHPMPSCTQPMIPRTTKSRIVGVKGQASGRETRMEKIPASMTAGAMLTLAWVRRRMTTFRPKATGTPRARRFPNVRPESSPSKNINTMPTRAAEIVAQVRRETRSPRRILPERATKKGPTLIRTSVLATVLRVTERMKKKKVEARRAPARTPGRPTSKIFSKTFARCQSVRTPIMKITMNTERQKTISQGSVRTTLRTRTPPVLQQSPAPIISSTPFRWARAASGIPFGSFMGNALPP